jgi:hypothetical protein
MIPRISSIEFMCFDHIKILIIFYRIKKFHYNILNNLL